MENDKTVETTMISGDLGRLTDDQRVAYYKQVCDSLGLNWLTQPLAYITLKTKTGPKLMLYATKGAADQLRRLHGVSITKIDTQITATHTIVTVTGQDKNGRTDVEIGMVALTDMYGDLANVVMKAITKAKRRLTFALCGLGMLDETETETIPGAVVHAVDVTTGEIKSPPVKPLTNDEGEIGIENEESNRHEDTRARLSKLITRGRETFRAAKSEGASTTALVAAANAANKALIANESTENLVTAGEALLTCIETLEGTAAAAAGTNS